MSGNETDRARAYVRRQRQKGRTDDEIRQIMLKGGWTQEQLKEVFAGEVPQAATPARRPAAASRPGPRPADTNVARFPLVNPGFARWFGRSCAIMWAILLTVAVVSHFLGGGLSELLTDSGGDNGDNGFIYLLVIAVGHTLVYLAFLHGVKTVVVLSDQALALQRWERTWWRIAWEDLAAWWRVTEAPDMLKALVVVDRQGLCRRLSIGFYGLQRSNYDALLAALRGHAPDNTKLADQTIKHSEWRWPLIMAAVILGTILIFWLMFASLDWGD